MISTLSRRAAPVAVLVTGLGSAALVLAPAAHAETTTVVFPSGGTEQAWQVPDGITSVHVVAVGGRGGSGFTIDGTGPEAGGRGARTSADLAVTPHQQLYIEVGGNGQDGATDRDSAGGFNGGGLGIAFSGAGGGGASDIRTVSSSAASGSLESRLLVAGGGGGSAEGDAGGSTSDGLGAGQPGAPDSGCDAQSAGAPGGGATASAGGAGGPGFDGSGGDGAFGNGGNGGGAGEGVMGGGGGGGGWYGGGGGGQHFGCGGGGGGGSSHVDSTAASNPAYGMDTTGTPQITISYLVPLAPLATTEPASGIGQSSATLNGVVNPEGFGASYHFEWGVSTGYEGTPTPETQASPTDSGQHAVSATLTGLNPGTQYHFRLVATNENGSTPGDDVVFTTAAATTVTGRAPLATTTPASSVGWVRAQLNGVVNARGAATTYSFEYGTTTAYGNTTPSRNIGAVWGNHSVKAQLTGLTRHTAYHFRVVATNANGVVHGVDRTFRTG